MAAIPMGNNEPIQPAYPTGAAVLQCSFPRPNDTVAYTAGDAITDNTASAGYMVFAGAGRSGLLWTAHLFMGTDATVGTPDFDLLVYDRPPVNGSNDNVAMALTGSIATGDQARIVGVFHFLAANKVTFGANFSLYRPTGPLGEGFTGPFAYSGDGGLYAQLVARSAFTPAANTLFSAKLHIDRQGVIR
jgi:hypothetical protein